jgi:hypothetical protein
MTRYLTAYELEHWVESLRHSCSKDPSTGLVDDQKKDQTLLMMMMMT